MNVGVILFTFNNVANEVFTSSSLLLFEYSRRPAFLSDTSFIDNDDGDSEDLIVEHNSECAHTEGGECIRVLKVVSKETISHPAEVESNIGGTIMDGYNSMATIPVSEKDPSQVVSQLKCYWMK